MLKNKNIAFLGAGSMAEAMISGIVYSKKVPPSQITVSNHRNKERLKTLKEKYNIHGISNEQLQIVRHDIIILAMKPKDAEDAIQSIAPLLQPDQLDCFCHSWSSNFLLLKDSYHLVNKSSESCRIPQV